MNLDVNLASVAGDFSFNTPTEFIISELNLSVREVRQIILLNSNLNFKKLSDFFFIRRMHHLLNENNIVWWPWLNFSIFADVANGLLQKFQNYFMFLSSFYMSF